MTEQEFTDIYNRHKKKIYSFCISRLKYDVAISEDITAIAFVQLWKEKQPFCDETHIIRFLFRVAKQRIINFYKCGKTRYECRMTEYFDVVDSSPFSISKAEYEYEELVVKILDAIDSLPNLQKDIVTLTYLKKLT